MPPEDLESTDVEQDVEQVESSGDFECGSDDLSTAVNYEEALESECTDSTTDEIVF